jgi:hypothetical protein
VELLRCRSWGRETEKHFGAIGGLVSFRADQYMYGLLAARGWTPPERGLTRFPAAPRLPVYGFVRSIPRGFLHGVAAK